MRRDILSISHVATEMDARMKGLFTFFQLCGKLKHLKRKGWVLRGVRHPESVADHMYRMSLMAFLFGGSADSTVNKDKCIKMALVHDLAESIIGDITPHDGISKAEKYQREKLAMEQMKTLVPPEVGSELYELWLEYEDGKSPEAIVVKDLDCFDMIFQAFEYEKADNRPKELQEFFDSTKGKFQNPEVQKWAEELYAMRDQHSSSAVNDTHKQSPDDV